MAVSSEPVVTARRIEPAGGGEMSELAHWDCWGWRGNRTVSRPEPNSKPEAAMELLLEKARLVFGDQDWSAGGVPRGRAHLGSTRRRAARVAWRGQVPYPDQKPIALQTPSSSRRSPTRSSDGASEPARPVLKRTSRYVAGGRFIA